MRTSVAMAASRAAGARGRVQRKGLVCAMSSTSRSSTRSFAPALPTAGPSERLVHSSSVVLQAVGGESDDPFDAIMAPSKNQAQTAGTSTGSGAPVSRSPHDFTDESSLGMTADSWGASADDEASGAGRRSAPQKAPGAKNAGSLLGLATLRTVQYPGSSVPFEQAVSLSRGKKSATSVASSAHPELDIPAEEIITTRSKSVSVTSGGTAKDFHHRYPQFTNEDLDEAFRATRRRWHGVTRWTRFYDDGESLSDQEEADQEAIMDARREAEAAAARGETSSIPIVRLLSTGEEQIAPSESAPVEEVLDFHRFDERTGADLVGEELKLRQRLREAVQRGDKDQVNKLTEEMEQRLGGPAKQEDLDKMHGDMVEEHALYHRRVGRFVDAVYGSNSREEGGSFSHMNDPDLWDPNHKRDHSGEFADKKESMFSLDRVLSERDPLRTRFLDKNSKFTYGPAAAAHSGLNIGYCLFCAHGHSHDAPGGLPLMREDNTLLLSRFISPDGRILPRRFTGVCSKHQRHLARTVKRSRALNLMPFQQKLNTQLRFTRMEPDPVTEPTTSTRRVSILGKINFKKETKKSEGAAELDAALDELQSMLDADANAGLAPLEPAPADSGTDARA